MKMVYYGALRAHLIDRGPDLVDCGVRSAPSPLARLPEFTPPLPDRTTCSGGGPTPERGFFNLGSVS